MRALEAPDEYRAMLALAREGLDVLRDAPPARRARLLGATAFDEFLLEKLPALADPRARLLGLRPDRLDARGGAGVRGRQPR